MGHITIISPQDLLNILIRQFDEALMYADDARDAIQMKLKNPLLVLCNLLILMLSVMRLIKYWLTNQNVIIANDVLAGIQQLADAVDRPDDLKELAYSVLQLIPDKV